MTDSIGADEAEWYQEPFAVPDAPGPSIDIMHEPHCQLQCQMLNTRPSYRQTLFLPDTSECSAWRTTNSKICLFASTSKHLATSPFPLSSIRSWYEKVTTSNIFIAKCHPFKGKKVVNTRNSAASLTSALHIRGAGWQVIFLCHSSITFASQQKSQHESRKVTLWHTHLSCFLCCCMDLCLTKTHFLQLYIHKDQNEK